MLVQALPLLPLKDLKTQLTKLVNEADEVYSLNRSRQYKLTPRLSQYFQNSDILISSANNEGTSNCAHTQKLVGEIESGISFLVK